MSCLTLQGLRPAAPEALVAIMPDYLLQEIPVIFVQVKPGDFA